MSMCNAQLPLLAELRYLVFDPMILFETDNNVVFIGRRRPDANAMSECV